MKRLSKSDVKKLERFGESAKFVNDNQRLFREHLPDMTIALDGIALVDFDHDPIKLFRRLKRRGDISGLYIAHI